jgi:CspA family cold shock protein
MAQYTGKVIWFSNAKGCGYLSRCGYPDVFIHFSAVIPDCYEGLSAGDEVTFDIIQGTKGT